MSKREFSVKYHFGCNKSVTKHLKRKGTFFINSKHISHIQLPTKEWHFLVTQKKGHLLIFSINHLFKSLNKILYLCFKSSLMTELRYAPASARFRTSLPLTPPLLHLFKLPLPSYYNAWQDYAFPKIILRQIFNHNLLAQATLTLQKLPVINVDA